MILDEFNKLSSELALEELLKCCSSKSWAEKLVEQRPYDNKEALFKTSDNIWLGSGKNSCLQAFDGHPKIGNINSLKEKYKKTESWAGNEQSGMDKATEEIIHQLADYNERYEKKYGYIFIVCATGKSASEMLDILKSRMNNDEETELNIAAGEQNKITRIRLEKLL